MGVWVCVGVACGCGCVRTRVCGRGCGAWRVGVDFNSLLSFFFFFSKDFRIKSLKSKLSKTPARVFSF